MSKKQNLLDSIMNYSTPTDELQTLGNRANHAISSIINILEAIDDNFDEQIAEDLQRRLFLSIKNRDYRKFEKGLENLSLHEKRTRRKDEKK